MMSVGFWPPEGLLYKFFLPYCLAKPNSFVSPTLLSRPRSFADEIGLCKGDSITNALTTRVFSVPALLEAMPHIKGALVDSITAERCQPKPI